MPTLVPTEVSIDKQMDLNYCSMSDLQGKSKFFCPFAVISRQGQTNDCGHFMSYVVTDDELVIQFDDAKRSVHDLDMLKSEKL